MMKKLFAVFLVLFTAGLLATTVFGADYLPKGEQDDSNVVVGDGEVYEDLYVGGGSVSIDTEILGDLFVGGGSVNVAGATEEDLFATGGNINVLRPVGDDARLAGGNVSLSAPVGGDVLAACGTIVISSEATVGGDMWIGGGTINFNSSVAGSAKISGGEIYINGRIDGPLDARANQSLTFGPNADVAGPIVYHGRNEAVVEEGAVIGAIEFREWESERAAGMFGATIGVFFFLKLLALLVAALVLLKLFSQKSADVISYSHRRPWMALGVGVAGLLVTPIIAALLVATAVGAFLGILLGLLFAVLSVAAGIFTVIYAGSIVEKLVWKKTDAPTWKTALWGILAGGLLSLIPVLGWLVILVLYVISFGSLLRWFRAAVEV